MNRLFSLIARQLPGVISLADAARCFARKILLSATYVAAKPSAD